MNRRWYFAGAGVILLALLLRQPLILIGGVLLLFLLGATDVWATYCLANLRFEHELSEKRVLFGEEITLTVTVENAKLLPLPWLEIEESMPRALGMRERTLRLDPITNRTLLESLFSIGWYERITRRYTVSCHARGVHTFGPTIARSGDLFGFIERQETLEKRRYLIVYPMIVPLSSFQLPARHPFGERRAPRRLLEDPARVIGVRDYAYGDELRRVHWKATARTLQLQSKVYEPTTTYTLVTFLNISTQFNAYFNEYPEMLELSICAAASISAWALDEGYAVGLYTNSFPNAPDAGITQTPPESQTPAGPQTARVAGTPNRFKKWRLRVPPGSSAEQRRRLMEALARVQPFFSGSIEELIQSEHAHLPGGSTVVVITATVSDPLLDVLNRLRQAGHAVTILLVGNQALSRHLAGIQVHSIGGDETWKQLTARYQVSQSEQHEPDVYKEATPTFHF